MNLHVLHDKLCFDNAPAEAYLALSAWREGHWHLLSLRAEGDCFRASADGIKASLRLERPAGSFHYQLEFASDLPTRLQLRLELPGAADPFHVIPGCIFGDNNLARAEAGHFPNLTTQFPGNVSCSPYWEMRADRASHPISILCARDVVAAVSVEPYSTGTPIGATVPESFVRNGVFAQVRNANESNACGVTLGYGNIPSSFINKDQWGNPTTHLALSCTTHGRIFLQPATSRLAAHEVIRKVYSEIRETPQSPINRAEAIEALVDALLRVSWHDATGHNALGTYSGKCSEFHGGALIAEHFTNMQCVDPEKKDLRAWRMLPEIGWSGGGAIAYPLLIAGQHQNQPSAIERAIYLLDWIAQAHNPASGLLWDVCGKNQKSRADGWWSGYLVNGVHSAYTNGNGLYYLLKSYRFARAKMGRDFPGWLETGLKALNTIVRLQLDDGSFGFTYRTDRREIVDREGFAGVWFVPALALAYELTCQDIYLVAARRGLAFYHRAVQQLECWGTPLDTRKSPEQEGILGFIRGARLLHELTGSNDCLTMLTDAAQYEYLWRYGFRTRPQCKPLAGSHFDSCGGSITSVSNPHIHPMGLNIASELLYLAQKSSDNYHAQRFEDGNNWALNIVSLYPDVTGYGIRGVLTERYCPSDGLLIDTNSDGSPSSISYTYNGWAATSALEGMTECDYGV